MDAILKIYGDIGEGLQEPGMGEGSISSKTVAEFLEANQAAKKIVVRINSRGGDVQEGWAIHDLLINSGKAIKTIGEGKIYSIATIIFLAGSEREIMQNADGLIHNPFIPPYTLADSYESGDLLKLAEGLKQEESKILDFYIERTGADPAKLATLMKDDTKLSAADMVELGFATKIVEPVMAFAYVKPYNKFDMTPEKEAAFFERLGTTLDSAVAKIAGFSRISVKAQVLIDKDGNELTLSKDTGVPATGDSASPDGTFIMESGKTITVSGGVITEILEPDPSVTIEQELEAAKQKVAELEAQVSASAEEKEAIEASKAELETAKAEIEAAKTELETARVDAVALVTELQTLKNTWKPDSRSKVGSIEKVGSVDLNRVKELNAKLNPKT